MQKRNITVGAILGAGLLGTLIAFGQDAPPRPRAVTPPPASETAPFDETPSPKTAPQAPNQVPEVPPLPIFPDPRNVIQTVQYVEPRIEPKKAPAVEVKDTLPKLPTVPPLVDFPVPTAVPLDPPKLPVPATSDILPPPMPPVMPVAPPKIDIPKVSEQISAPPTAWSPGDTVAPKDIRTPDAPPRAVPSIPVSNPVEQPPEGTSRFVVPPRMSQPPPTAQNQAAPTAPSPYVEEPSKIPAPYRFTMVRTSKTPDAAPRVPGSLPKMTEVSRPTGSDLHSPQTAPPTAPTADSQLGMLTPQLTVEKRGPLLHKVGGPLRYQIILKNVGAIPAQQVRVEDEIPGAQLLATTPIITQQQGDRLVWILQSLRPGEERTFMEELQPVRQGDVVSTTSVHVYASTSFRTRIEGEVIAPAIVPQPPLLTQPGSSLPPTASLPAPPLLTPSPFPPIQSPFSPPGSVTGTPTVNGPSLNPLPDAPPANPTPSGPALTPPPQPTFSPTGPIPMTVEVKALPTVGPRQTLSFEVIVSNKGPTALTKMMLYAKVPAGFRHPEGDNIGADLPDLLAGETKSFKMPLTAIAPGRYTVEIRVTAAPNFELVARPVVTVEASGMSIQQSAAPLFQIGKDNEIKIVVANNQPTAINQVQIVDVLPEGLEFVGASDRGLYQANSRTITWTIDNVPPGRARTVSLRVQPRNTGSFPHEVIAKAEDLPEAKSTSVYQVENFSNLQVQVQGRESALQEGKETIYQVRITNVGNSVATNVQTSLTLSAGLDPTGFAQAPTAYRVSGRDVVFAPIPRVLPGETKTITLGVRGAISGQQSVRVQIVGDQLRAPVTREERTQVYREK